MRMFRNGVILAGLALAMSLVIGCSNPNVTLANFERIQSGMSRNDVLGFMGEPDDEDSGGGGFAGFAATGTKAVWKSGGKKIIVTFVDDEVLLKLRKGF
ncbi:MAG: hypothetical protein H6819_07410 [Phycisphaerales bacterium]|nr:hypothetical protein [Phycisphaerales bacterium]